MAWTQFAGAWNLFGVVRQLTVATRSVPAWLAAGRVGVTKCVTGPILAPTWRLVMPLARVVRFR